MRGYILHILAFTALFHGVAFACPELGGIPNLTCYYGGTKIVTVGDSITRGVGDEKKLGGYPTRLGLRLNIPVGKVARPGITTKHMFRYIVRTKNLEILQDASIVILLLGVNDYFIRKTPGSGVPSETVADIRRIISRLRSRANVGRVIVGKLLPTKRYEQNKFIAEVNYLLTKQKIPLINFDRLSASKYISGDRLHPHSKGYSAMSKVAATFIRKKFNPVWHSALPDSDNDGIYDKYETQQFMTDPSLYDTDGDMLSDGDEVFLYGTNPLLVDSNFNGISDYDEVMGVL